MSGPGYSMVRLPDGTIVQAGIFSPDDGEQNWDSTAGYKTRAVVLRVYYVDDPEWAQRGWTSAGSQKTLVADVRTYGRVGRTLYRVPIAQRAHGLFDEDTWVPRGASQNIAGGNLCCDPQPTGDRPTEEQNLDGDHVIIGFLENDPAQPIVLPFTLGHPQSRRLLNSTAGRTRRIRHNGVILEWDKDGNLVVDATGAAKQELAAGGQEQSAAGIGGRITIKTKDGAGGVSKVELDPQGNLNLENGGNEKVRLTKVGGQVEIEATTKVQLTAPTVAVTASIAASVISPSVTMGPAVGPPPEPVVKHTSWAVAWGNLLTALTPLEEAWKTAPVSGTPVTHGEMAPVLALLKQLAIQFASSTTIATKAG